MTVEELREKLKKYPSDMKVVISECHWGYCTNELWDLDELEEVTLKKRTDRYVQRQDGDLKGLLLMM